MTTLSKNNDRQVWIDILKGVGIIAVVAGHVGNIVPPQFGLFRMPLFIFVAGFLFTINPDRKDYLFKKFVHLIVPYICFLLILYVPQGIMNVINGDDSVITAISRGIFGGPLLRGRSGVFWFITCLFFTQQLMNWFLTTYSQKVVLYIMIAFLCLSFISSSFFREFWLPWSLNGVLAAAPFFYAGFLFRKNPLNLKGFEFILLIAVILACIKWPSNLYNIKSNNFGIPVLSFASALVIIVSLISISKILARAEFTTIIFSNISKGSMIIMYMHQSVQFIIKSKVPNINPYILLVLVFVICLGFYHVIKRSIYARGLLLGSVKDFKLIFQPKFLPKIL